MNNWMEKYEKRKDEIREKQLKCKLEKLLNLLDEQCKIENKEKVIKEILDVYDELKIELCEYDENDYKAKKKQLEQIRYEIMRLKHIEDKESQSWNDYKKEELEEEELER